MLSTLKGNIFDGLLQKLPDAIIITNNMGIIELTNDKVFNVFGYSSEELIGKDIGILIPVPFRDRHRIHVQEYFKNPFSRKMAAHRKVSGLKKEGVEFEIDITLDTITVNGQLYAIASARDISDKKHLEEELQVENASLQIVNKGLEKYSYTLAHDLKAPLAKIEGLLDMLMLNVKERSAIEDMETIHQYLMETVTSMRSLINSTLEHAKNTVSKGGEEILCFSEIFNEIKNLIVVPEKFEIKIGCEHLFLPGKKIQFIQVFLNLLSNAIKFNNKEKAIILIDCEDLGNEYKFIFCDNGIGISEDKLNDIFKLFEKGIEQNQKSHGIGLYTVKTIIEARGGKIWVKSKLGVGTTFEFTWPKAFAKEV